MKNTTQKVLLVSPYLDVMGGGEQHVFSILKVFDDAGYQSDIVWRDQNILQQLFKTHGVSFSNASILQKLPSEKNYSHCIYVTDGSYFFSRASNTFIFFMYPKKELLPHGLLSKIKARRAHFFANGAFTAEKVQLLSNRNVEIIHPYIDASFFTRHQKKQKIILSVGRFFPHLHSKRQEVLVEAFIKLQKSTDAYKDYKLVLVGGLKDHKADQAYYNKLLHRTKDYKNIQIHSNISGEDLLMLYKSAQIYWHAAGYSINEDMQPEAVEHLGITPLQAMAAGAITMCYNNGGPSRYITHNKNGFLYDSIDDLVTIMKTMSADDMLRIQKNSKMYVENNFSKAVFEKKVKEYFRI